jgi:protein-tyrosine phosphatase
MGFFDRFFPKSPPPPLPIEDYSFLRVDMHSHLIPGIDDGVKTVEDSIACCRRFLEMGIDYVITTPHVMADGYCNNRENILSGRDRVRQALDREGIPLRFDAAAEYYLDENLSALIDADDLLYFGDRYVLIELSYMFPPHALNDYIYRVQLKGYRFVLAHPERYPYLSDKGLSAYKQLRDRSVFFQLNLGSFVGMYGPQAQRMAEQLADAGMVDFVSSDLHTSNQFEKIKKVLATPSLRKLKEEETLRNVSLINPLHT